MKRTALALASASALALASVATPAPAEARGGSGPWGAGYGRDAGDAPTYYDGYASAFYAYAPNYYYVGPTYHGGYTTAPYYDGYPPGWSGYHHPRVVRPAFAYYGGPGFWHYRWNRGWHRH